MSTLLILTVLVATVAVARRVRGLHRLSKSSRRRDPPALLSLKTRNLPDKLLEDDSGTPRSEMPMRLWF